jgi:hypothetical protein
MAGGYTSHEPGDIGTFDLAKPGVRQSAGRGGGKQ